MIIPRFSAKNLVAAVALATSVPAFAVDPATAQAVIELLEQTPAPSARATDFEKWAYDTLTFTAAGCWRAAYPDQSRNVPAVLKTHPRRAGTYASPSNTQLESECAALATTGFEPWCGYASVRGDRRSVDASLMREYLQMEQYTDKPQVSGGLYCYLSKSQAKAQFFVPDELTARWADMPTFKLFQVPGGMQKNLNAGTILVEVKTAPGITGASFSQPMTAILP